MAARVRFDFLSKNYKNIAKKITIFKILATYAIKHKYPLVLHLRKGICALDLHHLDRNILIKIWNKLNVKSYALKIHLWVVR